MVTSEGEPPPGSDDGEMSSQDLVFIGCVHPPASFGNTPEDLQKLGPNDFTERQVREMDLTGLPVTWEHDEDKGIGVVKMTLTSDDGSKHIIAAIDCDTEVGRQCAHQMERGEINELSLSHLYTEAYDPEENVSIQNRIPVRVGITKQGARSNCRVPRELLYRVDKDYWDKNHAWRDIKARVEHNSATARTGLSTMLSTSAAPVGAPSTPASQQETAAPPATAATTTTATTTPPPQSTETKEEESSEDIFDVLSNYEKLREQNLSHDEALRLVAKSAERAKALENQAADQQKKITYYEQMSNSNKEVANKQFKDVLENADTQEKKASELHESGAIKGPPPPSRCALDADTIHKALSGSLNDYQLGLLSSKVSGILANNAYAFSQVEELNQKVRELRKRTAAEAAGQSFFERVDAKLSAEPGIGSTGQASRFPPPNVGTWNNSSVAKAPKTEPQPQSHPAQQQHTESAASTTKTSLPYDVPAGGKLSQFFQQAQDVLGKTA